MAELKPIYLFHGSDSVKVGLARKRIFDRAKSEADVATLEVLEGEECSVTRLVTQIAAPPLSFGQRYILVDGVECFKAGELKELEQAVDGLAGETTLVMLGRGKTVVRLTKMVEEHGGEVRKFDAPKPWELPDWVMRSAAEIGLKLDRATADGLVAQVGTRQESLLRELEKIETATAGTTAGRELALELASGQVQSKVYEIGDALISNDREKAIRICDQSLSRGEDPLKLIYLLARQMRNVLGAGNMLESGHAASQIQSNLGLSPYATKHVVRQAKSADRGWLERSICGLADLEYSLKGGGSVDPETSLVASIIQTANPQK